MTSERRPSEDKNYKQMVIINYPAPKKYTSCKMSEEDYQAISPQWKEMREKVLEKAGYVCEICGSAINMHVHHKVYPEVWGEEKMEDLMAVCKRCHAKIHKKE